MAHPDQSRNLNPRAKTVTGTAAAIPSQKARRPYRYECYSYLPFYQHNASLRIF
jgi:hypothetical protein